MYDWEKFNETSLPEKEDFYSHHLNMEHIADPDYMHRKTLYRFWNSKFKRISWFVCLGDTLLLADVFGNFCNMCLEINELDPACFCTSPGLAWQAAIKIIQ